MSEQDTDEDAATVAPQQRLATLLRGARAMRELSVRRAASRAGISGTYLSNLEAGNIKEPSPHILRSLAMVYEGSRVSYADLMRAAGYIMPDIEATPTAISALDLALGLQTPLSDDERAALLEYLDWYRSRHGRPPETR
jgi:transcriptional regulator with XRE-family HTH domain